MTRQLEQVHEERQGRRARAAVNALEYDLVGSVAHAGGELTGLSVKLSGPDCLITVKAVLPGGRMVAFVGAETFLDALVKVCRVARADKLHWRADRYVGK